jgi:hypothetical protein
VNRGIGKGGNGPAGILPYTSDSCSIRAAAARATLPLYFLKMNNVSPVIGQLLPKAPNRELEFRAATRIQR